jgi:hypothetical protein
MNKNKLLGLLDVLESSVVDGKRVPLTQNIMVNEQQVIEILDKIRTVINSLDEQEKSKRIQPMLDQPVNMGEEAAQEAKKVKDGANKYAHYILSNLQLTVTKMQNNLVKLEKNIESGRNMIEEKTGPIEKDQSKNKEIYNEFAL